MLSISIISGTSLEAWYIYTETDMKTKSQNSKFTLILEVKWKGFNVFTFKVEGLLGQWHRRPKRPKVTNPIYTDSFLCKAKLL